MLFTDFANPDEFPFPPSCEVVPVSTQRQTLQAAGADGSRSLADMWGIGRTVSAARLDVLLFPTVYSWVPTWTAAPKLLMIHDVIAERLPRYIFPTLAGRIRWHLKSFLALAQADRVLTVSEFSRRLLIEQFGLAASDVAVIGEAPDPVFRAIQGAELPKKLRDQGLRPDARLITYVGGFGPHKNLWRLLDAFEGIASERRYGDVTLVLAGDHEGDSFYSEYSRLQRRSQDSRLRSRVVFTGFLRDEELVALLNCSAFLVLPSLMEGYGLPAVEAAACGLPVVVTKNSPIPELLGEGALPVDPDRTEDLRRGLVRLLDNAPLRDYMAAAGRAAVEKLTWERAAADLLEALEAATAVTAGH